jgi:hypothetical protein
MSTTTQRNTQHKAQKIQDERKSEKVNKSTKSLYRQLLDRQPAANLHTDYRPPIAQRT